MLHTRYLFAITFSTYGIAPISLEPLLHLIIFVFQ